MSYDRVIPRDLPTCKTCGEPRPPGPCRSCARIRQARYKARHPDQVKATKARHRETETYAETRRAYEQRPEVRAKQRERDAGRADAREAYKTTPAGKAAARRADLNWLANNPEKHAAHKAVNIAVAAGKLVKPIACEACGKQERIHGHHENYAAPLFVRWLCAGCHHAIHQGENA